MIDFYVSTLSLSYYTDAQEFTRTGLYTTLKSKCSKQEGKNVNKAQWTQTDLSNIK